jgi:hypothetical protein
MQLEHFGIHVTALSALSLQTDTSFPLLSRMVYPTSKCVLPLIVRWTP